MNCTVLLVTVPVVVQAPVICTLLEDILDIVKRPVMEEDLESPPHLT